MWRCLRADLLKLRRTKILWIHVAIPVVCAVLFLGYFHGRKMDSFQMYAFYMESIGVALPLLLGMITGLIVYQERRAGHFQVLLSGSASRLSGYTSKLLLLILLEAFSILLAVVLWVAGMKWVLHLTDIPLWSYVYGWLWLTGSSLLIWIVQLFSAFVFGMGASILLGGAGLLLSALMATGLGDGIWMYVPWAWGVRFSGLTGLLQEGTLPMEWVDYVQDELKQGLVFATLLTSASLVLSMIWFRRWEGKQAHE